MLGCLVIVVAVSLVAALISLLVARHQSVTDRAAENSAKIASDEDKGAAWGALAVASLRHSLRDPDSLAIESVYADTKGTVACITYRARNGFGGLNKDSVVFTKRGGDSSNHAWNRLCAGRSLSNVTQNALNMETFLPNH